MVEKYGADIVEQVLYEHYSPQTDGLILKNFSNNDQNKIVDFLRVKPQLDNLETMKKADQEVRAEYKNYLDLKNVVIKKLAGLFANEETRSRVANYGIGNRVDDALQNDINRNVPPNEVPNVGRAINYLESLDTSLSLSGLKYKIIPRSSSYNYSHWNKPEFESLFKTRHQPKPVADTYWGGRNYQAADITFDNTDNPEATRIDLINYQKFLSQVSEELDNGKSSTPIDILHNLSDKKWPAIKTIEAELETYDLDKKAGQKFPDKYLNPHTLEPTAEYQQNLPLVEDFMKQKAVVDKHLRELVGLRLLESGVYKQKNENYQLLSEYKDFKAFGEFTKKLEEVERDLPKDDLERSIKLVDKPSWQAEDLKFYEQYKEMSTKSQEAGIADKYKAHISKLVSDIFDERHKINKGLFVSQKQEKLKKLDDRLKAVQLLNNNDARFLLKISQDQLAALENNLPAEQMAEINKFRADYSQQEGNYAAKEKYSREFTDKLYQAFKLFKLDYNNPLYRNWTDKKTTPKELLIDAKMILDKMKGAWETKNGPEFLANLKNLENLYRLKAQAYGQYERNFTPVKFELPEL
jgi:hypothetical protein